MKPSRSGVARAALALCLGPLLASGARTQSVPLSYGAAEDAHMVVHGVASLTPDPALVALEKALTHLVASAIHEDILDLVTMDLRAKEADRVRATFHHVLDLFGRVDWADLMAREVLLVEHFALPMPEYTLICRVPEDHVAAHLAGVRSMCDGFAEMIGDAASVAEVEQRNGEMVVFRVQGAPVQFATGAVGDVMIFSTSTQSTKATLRRLQSDGRGSLHHAARFQESLEQLPANTEGTFYLNVKGLMGFAGQVLQFAAGAVGDDPKADAMVALCRALVEELDVVDHLVVSTASDGTTVTQTTLVRMQPDSEDSRLVELYAKQQPWTDWHRHVPANATSFYFDAGIDVGGLVDWLTELAVDSAGGPDHAPWARSREFTELRKILGHLSGESACVTFPRAGEAGCALGETVMMIRLEKTDDVSRWLRAHLDHFARYAGSRGQNVEVTSDGEMHEVAIEALPWIHPVVGVHEGFVVMASSPAALEQIRRVQRGEAADIRSAARFAALGIGNAGPYLDYQQLDAPLTGFHDLLAATGFFLSMLPEDRDNRAAIKLGAILGKLAPALGAFDLSFDSGADLLPSPSPDVVMMRRVTRYRQ